MLNKTTFIKHNEFGALTGQETFANLAQENSSANILNNFYAKDNQNKFMKKIDKLNINFLLLSDKYVKLQNEINRAKDNLFLNLFQQVSIYVEEIERLNVKLQENKGNVKALREVNLKMLKKELQQYKTMIKTLEMKLNEKNLNEEKLKKEIAGQKRQLTFYKDQLKLELQTHVESSIYHNKKTQNKDKKKPICNIRMYNYQSEKVQPKPSFSPQSKKKNNVKGKERGSGYLTSRCDTSIENDRRSSIIEKGNKKHHKNRSVVGVKDNRRKSKIFGSILDTEFTTNEMKEEEEYNLKEKKLSDKEKLKIIGDLGIQAEVDINDEIKMLTEQENEIAMILKYINKKGNPKKNTI